MSAPVQSSRLNFRHMSQVGGIQVQPTLSHLRSARRARRRGPEWNLCPLGNLRVRVSGGGGGAAGAPEDPAPPPGRTERSPWCVSCSSSRHAASDTAARLARRMARSSTGPGRALPVRAGGGGGGAAGASASPAPPPSRSARIARSSPTRITRRGTCSSSCRAATGAAPRLLPTTSPSSSPAADRDLPDDVDGGAGALVLRPRRRWARRRCRGAFARGEPLPREDDLFLRLRPRRRRPRAGRHGPPALRGVAESPSLTPIRPFAEQRRRDCGRDSLLH